MTGQKLASLEVLPAQVWRKAEAEHASEVETLTRDRQERAGRGVPHPVEDFLFTYYSLRPAQLRRWYPGAGIALADAGDRADWPFHVVVEGSSIASPSIDSRGINSRGINSREIDGRPHDGAGPTVTVDVAGFARTRRTQLDFTRRLLSATAAAPAQYGCFGLHEWAMVFEQDDERRHQAWPLRLGQAGTDEVVRKHQIRCTHYDAFRFFTPAARPRNPLQPDLGSRVQLEQPGCLHASMDLYKWAYKLMPIVPSTLLLDCFRLARTIREMDMRASPYDLTDLGYPPVAIETAAGKAEYVAAQREFAHAAQVLRGRLLRVITAVDAETIPTG
ncbi:3-methyladenine DNA glycosylase [Nakamurella sp. GG22]